MGSKVFVGVLAAGRPSPGAPEYHPFLRGARGCPAFPMIQLNIMSESLHTTYLLNIPGGSSSCYLALHSLCYTGHFDRKRMESAITEGSKYMLREVNC